MKRFRDWGGGWVRGAGTIGLRLVVALAIGLTGLSGCRCGDASEDQTARSSAQGPAAPSLMDTTAYLEGAVLHGRYDSTALATLGRDLPRPTATDSPLVAVFSGIVEQLRGPPNENESLAAVGLAPASTVELSVRPLDGRTASARKLLGELVADPSSEPALRERLDHEAGTLGLHLRASLRVSDQALLVAALAQIVGGSGEWTPTCASLADTLLCTGRERLLIWARPGAGDRVRVDALYLFRASADAGELAWIATRADRWALGSPSFAANDPNHDPNHDPSHDLELEIHAPAMLRLLQTEALADAIDQFTRDELDYHGYLDREQALADLLPSERVFDGVNVGVNVGVDVDERLAIETRWIPSSNPPVPIAELFAGLTEAYDLPEIDASCSDVPVCAGMAGLTAAPRFSTLAVGPFADSTGAARVLRQAGDRGPILLMLASWPNVVGTAGRMTEASGGLLAEAQAGLIEQAYAVGATLIELRPAGQPDRWVAYVRVGPRALMAVRPLAGLAGLGPRPITLDGVDAPVDRGRYESDSTPAFIYFVDERELSGGSGGWLLAADSNASASWLLTRPREPAHDRRTIGFLRIRELAPLAAREDVPFGDDPPVASWLSERQLGVELRLTPTGPVLDLELLEQP